MITDEINLLLNSGSSEAKREYLRRLAETTTLVNSFIKTLLAGSDSSFVRKKIDEELKRIMDSSRGIVATIQQPQSVKKELNRYDPDQLPPELQKLHKEILDLYAENKNLRGRLQQIFFEVGGNKRTKISHFQRNDAHSIAIKIVSNDMRIHLMYSDIDYFLDTGELRKVMDDESELTMLRNWLSIQIDLHNYIAKSETYHRKHGRYPNETRYTESKAIQKEIQQYLLKHE